MGDTDRSHLEDAPERDVVRPSGRATAGGSWARLFDETSPSTLETSNQRASGSVGLDVAGKSVPGRGPSRVAQSQGSLGSASQGTADAPAGGLPATKGVRDFVGRDRDRERE